MGSESYKDWCPLVTELSQVQLLKGISTEEDFFSQLGRGVSSVRKGGAMELGSSEFSASPVSPSQISRVPLLLPQVPLS